MTSRPPGCNAASAAISGRQAGVVSMIARGGRGGVASIGPAQARSQRAGGLTRPPAAREHVHGTRRIAVPGDLQDKMRGAAEADQAERLAVAVAPVARNAGLRFSSASPVE